jgi:hypothetical protein
MEKRIEELLKIWPKKNISGLYCRDSQDAVKKILELVPKSASVGLSGSVTLDTLGVVALLEERGNRVFNQYRPGISRGESLELRRQGAQQADYFLTGANAVAETGELVFFSAYGNRTSGIAYAKNVIVACGINKLAPDLPQAIRRARQEATPLNCKRLNYNTPCLESGVCDEGACVAPEYKRMCCQVLVIEAEVTPDRLKVVMVDEKLGF